MRQQKIERRRNSYAVVLDSEGNSVRCSQSEEDIVSVGPPKIKTQFELKTTEISEKETRPVDEKSPPRRHHLQRRIIQLFKCGHRAEKHDLINETALKLAQEQENLMRQVTNMQTSLDSIGQNMAKLQQQTAHCHETCHQKSTESNQDFQHMSEDLQNTYMYCVNLKKYLTAMRVEAYRVAAMIEAKAEKACKANIIVTEQEVECEVSEGEGDAVKEALCKRVVKRGGQHNSNEKINGEESNSREVDVDIE